MLMPGELKPGVDGTPGTSGAGPPKTAKNNLLKIQLMICDQS